MTQREAKKLAHGLYVLEWKDGGYSLASVGSDSAGRRWFAPTNWVRVPWFKWGAARAARLVREEGDYE